MLRVILVGLTRYVICDACRVKRCLMCKLVGLKRYYICDTSRVKEMMVIS